METVFVGEEIQNFGRKQTVINSYGSIYALGHKAVATILDGEVELTEKVDGSQISFGIINGELSIRSKGQQLHLGADNGMFNLAVEQIQRNAHLFSADWVYRGEYFSKPKHNTLAYDRVPLNNIMVYDVEKGPGSEDFLRWAGRDVEVARIGFEAIPNFYSGTGVTFEDIQYHLAKESVLGGVKIEGVVVKNYSQFTEDKKIAKAKFVSTEFQEKHQKEWKKTNPTRSDIIEELITALRTEARWRKSVQHLRDDGRLEGSPRDIGNLIKETQNDVLKEEEDFIKEKLFQHFKGQIMRGVVSGLPEAYKLWLAQGEING